jgi:hypothetical protein
MIKTNADLSALQTSNSTTTSLAVDTTTTGPDTCQDNSRSDTFDMDIEEDLVNKLFSDNENDVITSMEFLNTIREVTNQPQDQPQVHIITYFKAQPACRGHAAVIEVMLKIAIQEKCQHTVLLQTKTDNVTRPLNLVFNKRYLEAYFPKVNIVPLTKDFHTPEAYFAHLHSTHKIEKVVWVMGKKEFNDPSRAHLRMQCSLTSGIKIETRIIPDQPTSSAEMREAAKRLQLREFSAMCPSGVSQYMINCVYKDVRAGMKNPTPLLDSVEDIIKLALGKEENISFQPISKFNTPQMKKFADLMKTDESELDVKTKQFLRSNPTNDTEDLALHKVVRT